jgi:hypothetical protein
MHCLSQHQFSFFSSSSSSSSVLLLHLLPLLRIRPPVLFLIRINLELLTFWTVSRTPCTGDQPIARPLPVQNTNTDETRSQCLSGRWQFMPYTVRPPWSAQQQFCSKATERESAFRPLVTDNHCAASQPRTICVFSSLSIERIQSRWNQTAPEFLKTYMRQRDRKKQAQRRCNSEDGVRVLFLRVVVNVDVPLDDRWLV